MTDAPAAETAEARAERIRRSGYDLERDFMPLTQHNGPELPNFEPMPLEQAVQSITGSFSFRDAVHGYAGLPGEPAPRWAWLFASAFPYRFDGSGIVLLYGGNPAAGRFAICKHDKVDGAGANHSRGWHPGRCSKCGLDLSVDSGD